MLFQLFSKQFLKASRVASFVAPIALGTAVMGFGANSAHAASPGFAGVYDPANWTQIIVQDGSVDTTNAPASITLIGPDNAIGAGKTDFTIAAPYLGQVTFDWAYSTLDISGTAEFDPFGYLLNGNFTQLTDSTLGNQAGSAFIDVLVGDTFGFSQRSDDSDFGASQTIIGNFVAPTGDPGPAPTSVPAPLPLVGAAAAFGWSRKLRRRIKTQA